MRQALNSEHAAAIGPYSHAVVAPGPVVACSGQTPLDPTTGRLTGGDIGAQTRRCLDNLLAVLAAGGLGPDDIVKTNVYLVDMADFEAMNAAYETYFDTPYPARTTVGVAALPLGARVEINCLAAVRPGPDR